MQMKNNRSDVGPRAWNILRLALLWARKGGVFKRRLMLDLPNYLKTLRNYTAGSSSNGKGAALHYRERQLSFDDTPIIHVKMHRPSSLRFRLPHIPCINPHIDFRYDFSDDQYNEDRLFDCINDDGGARKSFLKGVEDDHENDDDKSCGSECDEGIDRKAEEFIANFYQQMRLQRQISYLQYNQ